MKKLLPLMSRPSHYIGIEEGALQKSARLRCALAFPDLYEVGMSYLGQKILYSILNQREEFAAERVFAPTLDVGELLRQHQVPLATLESDTPLKQVDLLGFAITHELCYTNILYMLDLAGIPLRAADRGDNLTDYPLIVAGGGCAISAEPITPFMDLMLLGEGEEMVPELCERLLRAKDEKWTKKRFIRESVNIAGVYAPSLYKTDVKGYLQPLFPDLPKAGRRIVTDMDQAAYPVQQVVPFGAVHNRLSLEIARGCTRGCRFCQAGILYRPARERSLPTLEKILDLCLSDTGFDDVSFLSLSSGDFSALKTLFLDTIDRCTQEQIAVSLPSLRVGSVDDEIMKRMAHIRRTGATLAPEAGSQRLRDVINKGIREEELLAHVRALAGHGWQMVKLYFMIGLPTETQEDLDAIADLCLKTRDVAGRPRIQVTASVSPFVPKPFTVFQWERQNSLSEMREKVHYLREKFRQIKGLKLRWHDPEVSYLEGIFSRGDRRLADVVELAYRKGALFASWMDQFKLAPWLEAMQEVGLDPELYTGARDENQVLAWDHLESGVSREFLLRERKRAFAGKVTADCRYAACQHCGICDTAQKSLLPANGVHNQLNLRERDQTSLDLYAPVVRREKPKAPELDPALTIRSIRYRIWHHKTGESAYLSQLELQTVLHRALRRAEIPLSFSQGFHPMPLLSFGRALPVGVESLAECFSITLRQYLSSQDVKERLAPRMLRGMDIERLEEIPIYEKTLGSLSEDFVTECLNPTKVSDFVQSWIDFATKQTFPLLHETKKGKIEIDLRHFVKKIDEEHGRISFSADWSEDYISPLSLVRGVIPWIGLQELKIVKISQKLF